MKSNKLLVSFAVIASMLFLMSVVAAEITDDYTVSVRDNVVGAGDVISVVEGETIPIKVSFTSSVDALTVKIEAEIDGYKVDVETETDEFDVKAGSTYSKTLSLKIPHDLDDEISEEATLEIKISNKDDESELADIVLGVQKESFNAEVMSISTTQSADSGMLFPVDVVLKNNGYNNLEDLYVTVRIADLGVERTSYFGDLVALEDDDDDDDTDTVSGRLYIQIPDNAKAGTYTLEVEVKNEDTTTVKTKEVYVDALEETLIKSGNDLIIVNPTSKVKVYKVVSTDAENFVVVPAGSSRAMDAKSGEYNVFDGANLVGSVVFGDVDSTSEGTSPIAILTVILAIVFIVLLIVLFVLIGKKPESEEFGESYY